MYNYIAINYNYMYTVVCFNEHISGSYAIAIHVHRFSVVFIYHTYCM